MRGKKQHCLKEQGEDENKDYQTKSVVCSHLFLCFHITQVFYAAPQCTLKKITLNLITVYLSQFSKALPTFLGSCPPDTVDLLGHSFKSTVVLTTGDRMSFFFLFFFSFFPFFSFPFYTPRKLCHAAYKSSCSKVYGYQH